MEQPIHHRPRPMSSGGAFFFDPRTNIPHSFSKRHPRASYLPQSPFTATSPPFANHLPHSHRHASVKFLRSIAQKLCESSRFKPPSSPYEKASFQSLPFYPHPPHSHDGVRTSRSLRFGLFGDSPPSRPSNRSFHDLRSTCHLHQLCTFSPVDFPPRPLILIPSSRPRKIFKIVFTGPACLWPNRLPDLL